MSNFESENYPFENKAQLFEKTINNLFNKVNDEFISYDLWENCFNQFEWLFFDGDILQCLICQKAFENFPNLIENDKWTTPNRYNFVKLNQFNIILILKVHNFSDNHILSLSLLNDNFDISDQSEKSNLNQSIINNDNSDLNFVSLEIKSIHHLNDKTENMELLRNFNNKYFNFDKKFIKEYFIDLVKEDNHYLNNWDNFINNDNKNDVCNLWGRYLVRYNWLYLKDDNPGCRYCEDAFKLSLQMSFTKWTSPNILAETISQDRPNRTLLQHDRSKNHRVAEDVLIEKGIITSPHAIKNQVSLLPKNIIHDTSLQKSDHPNEFTIERWNRFTKNYPWLYFTDHFFHCTYCERAYELHRNRMTHTSWTSSHFDCSRIKDFCKARHYFYDHQRSNNHRVATNILEVEGIISNKFPSNIYEDEYEGSDKISIKSDEEESCPNYSTLIKNTTLPREEELSVLSDKQWQQLCSKYTWLVGDIGKCYGCKVCQAGRKVNSLTVNLSQWTQGPLQFTKTKYIQLRKSLWCHSITRNHINAAVALQNQ